MTSYKTYILPVYVTNYSETNYMYCGIHHGMLQSIKPNRLIKSKKGNLGRKQYSVSCLHNWYPKSKTISTISRKNPPQIKNKKQAAETMKRKNNGPVIHR